MKSSSYIIELIVAGAGAMVWLILILFIFVGYDWISLPLISEPALVIVFSPFLYIAGVVTDRLVDNLFDRWFKENYKNPGFLGKEEYIIARTKIYTRSDSLRELIEYSKMRIRICRAWAFNSMMIMIAGDLFVLLSHSPFELWSQRWGAFAGITVSFLLFSFLSFRAWRSLSLKEAEYLAIQSKVLDEMR
ncbi:MAG: hypothetical protein SF052_07580 [Bacteroidia bacterium]|nr:hypothetical protein [Bacteroidia bacterium]